MVVDIQVALDELCGELRRFNGHRTVWLGTDGLVWHAEPDELLEELGHRYVGTFLWPTAEELGHALQMVLPRARPATPTAMPDEPDYGVAAMPALG